MLNILQEFNTMGKSLQKRTSSPMTAINFPFTAEWDILFNNDHVIVRYG